MECSATPRFGCVQPSLAEGTCCHSGDVRAPAESPGSSVRRRCARRRSTSSVAAWGAVAALVSWLAAPVGHAQQQQWRWTDIARVVVIGDVHGAYDALVEALRDTGLIGADLRWTGGTTHLVSLGDLLDRGADVREVLDLVMRLENEASAAGGRVHVLLGNHELMNLTGDLRYVARGDYAAFVGEEDTLRADAYAAFAAASPVGDADATRAEFEAAYPPGFFARQAAFAPSGRYGAWLLSLPTILVINDTAYVHGGLPPIVAEAGLDLNLEVRGDLERYLELRERLAAQGALSAFDRRGDIGTARAALSSAAPGVAAQLTELIALDEAVELGLAGPHWYRGSVYCKPLLEEPTLDAALERLGARRAIVGHTPTVDHLVRALYGGRLIMADTGMLFEYFGGQPAALVLDGAALDVHYLRPARHAGVETSGMLVAHGRTEGELRAALADGTATMIDRGEGVGPWRVVLGDEGAAIEATFVPRGRDGAADFELAAATLDDLLGTALVPPTVERTIDGQDGALQLRYSDAVTEADRAARAMRFSGWCPIEPQLRLMYVFDLLIGNRARAPANVAFANDLTDLVLTAHGQAFGTERTMPPSVDPAELGIPPALVAALRSLDEAQLRAALGEWLDSRRIRALLARRERLLEE
jgi:hypothetical protein